MEIKLIESTETLFDDYYRIRCNKTDIYWMGHKSAPDYQTLKESYISRLNNCRFSQVGDKRVYLIGLINDKQEEKIVGQLLLSICDDGLEVGLSLEDNVQGMGIGTESIRLAIKEAKKYSYRIIYANVRDDNFASQKMVLKNNFSRTDSYVENEYPYVGIVKLRKYIFTL